MKKNTWYTVLALGTLVFLTSCDAFVSDVEDPIDVVPDDQLNTPEQVPFLISGVQAEFSSTYGSAAELGGGLSDELIFDRTIPSATFPTFEEIDQGDITVTNNSVDGLYNDLGELRFFADKLVQRVTDEITFEGPEEQALQAEALYIGHLYGGIARALYAGYFGLEPTRGGGVIAGGPFIPSAEMYDLAIADFDSARATGFVEPGSYEERLLNSLAARSYLYKAELEGVDAEAAYNQAQALAQEGLTEGDDPFQELHNVQLENPFYFGTGPGRIQFASSDRYAEYEETAVLPAPDPDLAEAALETARVVLYEVPVEDDDGTLVATFYEQGMYLEREAPLNVVTWQENHLMLAELALRLDGDEARALELVNAVRASHNLEPLTSITLTGDGANTIETERAKELYVTGARLIDQRRFDTFHSIPGPWRYLPITASERNQNPNLE